ncbi:unnamed protein product [Tilletia controversa]|uniref:SGS domain-containing protein n=3 Tax=Tilletia TaxID=13289 RepID=A0A8X7N296_9BASI|nr:hypothetical protein CF336_g98 [Tilletia laevis]KAE8204965.1 hypothetical protein CF328_g769 [Tilletia controversa]KAE8265079.1 hypothetical protein A4X03_0g498 [Tilletia caries]KAE8208542.1 hypothetical protein CF335_g331 [Tilletia laevis]KAE8255931.1 hypothetical protein A4X06_0g166 [Tilletia controversa]
MAEAVRTDFYQTDTHVHVSLYARKIQEDTVTFTPETNGFTFLCQNQNLIGQPQTETTGSLTIARKNLFSDIIPDQCTYTVRPTKAELHLRKAQPALHWPRLHRDEKSDNVDSAAFPPQPSAGVAIPTPPTMSTASILPKDAPVRKKNKWEDFKLEDDDDEVEADSKAGGSASTGAQAGGSGEKKGDGGDVNDFFKKLYAGASDDARRAMMKSFQESNGTTLSMNWDEVKKGTVETRPPDSMVARKYE